MTDINGASDTGNPNGSGGEGAQGQAPDAAAMFADLDEGTREWISTRHGNDPVKLAKQAFELDKFAGSAVQVPEAGDADGWGKLYDRLGRPAKAEGYEFSVPSELPETVTYNQELADGFRDKAHEAGLTKSQATALHDWVVTKQADFGENFQQSVASDLQATITTANETLQAKWGEPDSETYTANLEMAGRFFDAVDETGGLKESLTKAGLTGPNGEILVADLALAFAKAGAALFTEGSTLTEGEGLTGVNPFQDGGNLTKIMALAKADPDKARVLARQAGVDPSRYGL